MGTTERLFRTHFFFTDVENPTEELSPACLQLPSRVFRGYYGKHHYVSYGAAEAVVNTVENEDGIEELVGMSYGVSGPYNTFLEIKGHYIKSKDDLEQVVLCEKTDGSNGGEFPVCLINADVLPWYEPGTILFGQMASYAVTMELYSSREECLDHFPPLLRDAMVQSEGHILMETHGPGEISSLWGRVVNRHMLPVARKVKGRPHPGLPYFEVETTLGRLGMVIPSQKMFEPGFIDRLNQPDCYVYTRFILTLDVAVGEYQEGAVFDENHLLKVLGSSLSSGAFLRLYRNLSEDCVLSGNATVEGRQTIKEYLEEIYRNQKANGATLTTFMGVVDKTGDGGVFQKGKECLILVSSETKSLVGFAFITLNKDHQIDWIEFSYDPGAYRVNVVAPRDAQSFGVSMEKAKEVSLKSPSEWATILASWWNGKKTDTTEIYGSLLPEVCFFTRENPRRGRDNVYLLLAEVGRVNRNSSSYFFSEGDHVVHPCLGFDEIYTVRTDKAGRIESIEKGYAKKEEVTRKEETPTDDHDRLLLLLAEAIGDKDAFRILDYLSEDFLFEGDKAMMAFTKETFSAFLEMAFQWVEDNGSVDVIPVKDPMEKGRMLSLRSPGHRPMGLRITVKNGLIDHMELMEF
ncbi:MAG: hypothetical protein KBS81_05995 [Spirochaetales bacterium]|nr:hypothetical protein [Candidatus Physcosoma equi]